MGPFNYFILFGIFLLVAFAVSNKPQKLRLMSVQVEYTDKDYIGYIRMFSVRNKRRDSYKTNGTIQFLQANGNNVSVLIYYKQARNNIEHVLVEAKLCDGMKINWLRNLFEKYTNVTLICPVPVGIYKVLNLELMSKTFPLVLPPGDHYLGYMHILTTSKKVLLNIEGKVNVG